MDPKKAANEKSIYKVRFSIGAKLITIISVIILVSLGSITALVSWLVREDLKIAAEEKNFEVNRYAANEAELTLGTIRSASMLVLQAIAGKENIIAEETVGFFFEQNPGIAALFISSAGTEQIFLNNNFFLSYGMETSLADSFYQNNKLAFERAIAGETILINVYPHFSKDLLALFFPWQNEGAGVLFSPLNLSDTFGYGTNQSYLINDSGDILVHADSRQVETAVNVAGREFTQYIRNSNSRTAQTLYTEEEIRYIGAFTKLNIAGCTVVTSIEYNKVFEGIEATTRRNLYLTAAVLFISIMLIWFFAKSISDPLRTLAAAAQTIEGGAFDVELRPKGSDEIGVLTNSFRQMCSALGVFGRFTNKEIAVKAMRGEIKPGGLPKHATVFFSDIRDFTEKSENFTNKFGEEASNRIVLWLNAYLSRMVDCIEKTGGVIDKFIGDAVMAHWGTAYTSGSPQRDAFNCIKAALMMRAELVKMNRDYTAQGSENPPIRIGCGINTGIVTAGQIGSDLRMEYTVIGDPVNLASRTEALNKPLATDILITENTWNLVKSHFLTEEMPPVTVKGKEKPVRIFAVVNFSCVDKRPQTLADVRKLLGINPPDVLKADTDEQKYKIG